MSKFTPGPWDYCGYEVMCKDGTTVCNMSGYKNQGTNKANARLIASTPCLLEALESAISMLNTKELDGSDIQELDRIDRVIAKATKGDE